MQLPDVALPDAQGEDLHASLPQGRRHGPGVPTVGVAVGDQENGFGGVGAGVAQDLLSEEENVSLQNVLGPILYFYFFESQVAVRLEAQGVE